MKKLAVLIVLFSIISVSICAQSNIQKFWNLVKQEKFEDAEVFLQDWEKSDKRDPELYVAYFNYYITKARTEQMRLESKPPASGQFMEAENDDGDKVYIYSLITYEEEYSKKAIEAIDTGLSYNPKRLDMHFGKAQFLFMREQYSEQKDLLKKLIALNKKYKTEWLWSNNTKADSIPVVFEDTIHEYIGKLLSTENKTAIKCSLDLSLLFMEEYPDNPMGYNDAGLSCIYLEDFNSAKQYYKTGYERIKTDEILLANLARVCKELGDNEDAIKYYKILAESTNEQYVEHARTQLEGLE